MPPKNYTRTILEDWFKAETDKARSIAIKYIEENVDLIESDLQKFMDDCPRVCQIEVYEMLLKAGIDMGDYVHNSSLKRWDRYIHDTNQYYTTIDYKQQLKYVSDIIEWETKWLDDAIASDTLEGVVE